MPEAVFLDVGQGHSVVVRDGLAAAIVDCPRSGADRAIDEVRDAERVDIFVTHRDLDHCGGIPKLISDVPVGRVILNYGYALPPEAKRNPRVKAVLSAIFDRCERAAIEIENAYRGYSGALGDLVQWEILWPTSVIVGRSTLDDSVNRASLVIRFEAGDYRILITGDIDDYAIGHLIDEGSDLSANALQLPHHGSERDKIGDLISAVNPDIINASFGRVNAYGHPALAVLEKASARCQLFCSQVSMACEAEELDDHRCAGDVLVEMHGGTVRTEIADHADRVRSFDSPRCVNSDGQAILRLAATR